MTVHGHLRRRWRLRLDVEHALILIGVIGVLAAVAIAIALWGRT